MSLSDKTKIIIAHNLLSLIKLIKKYKTISFLIKIEQKLKLSLLYRTDRLSWIAEKVREKGVTFGKNCRFYTREFSSEPYLVEIGDNVCVASGTQFITHDGGGWLFYDWQNHDNDKNLFGKIKIGNNCFIGINCIILPGSEIGNNCVIGAGSVVRGKIPSDSIVLGNPAKVIMKTSFYERMIRNNKNFLHADLYNLGNNSQKDEVVRSHFAEEVNPVESEN